MGLFVLLFSLFVISTSFMSLSSGQAIFDVTKFGAIGNGAADDTSAFLKAWAATCGAAGTPTMVVPKRTFLLKSIPFRGPCKPKAIRVQILGTLLASKTLKACFSASWLSFEYVDGLTVFGSGKIDGQGAAWWNKANLNAAESAGSCGGRPTGIKFFACNNLQLSGLTHINSPQIHILIINCANVILSKLTILAPGESPNTDGIDIMRSSHVQVKDSVIGTGDDCIAINEATSFIDISNVHCGPGHGISIGSLGQGGAFESSEEVQVRNCSFTGTQNGVRIKTYSGGKGYVRKVTYEGIIMEGVDNPIIIDQNYCNGRTGCARKATGLSVSDVTYSNIRGSSSTAVGVKLDCNSGNGCKNIKMNNVNIVVAGSRKPAGSYTAHVQGTTSNTIPAVPMNN